MASLRRSLGFGALCASVGLAVGGLLAWGGRGGGWAPFCAAAPVSAFACGATAWWAVVGRSGGVSVVRGLLAGGAAGVVAHPVCWALLFVPLGLAGGENSFPVAVAKLSVTSLVLFGGVTVPAGAAFGGWWARRLRALGPDAPPRGAGP
jgi:hypothetical protein